MRTRSSLLPIAVFVFALGCSGTGGSGTGSNSSGKSDQDLIQGTWSVVESEREGKKIPEEEYKNAAIKFEGDKMTIAEDTSVQAGNRQRTPETMTFKLDPSKSPREIEMTLQRTGRATSASSGGGAPTAPGRDDVVRGIYELNGDTLKICMTPDGPPPTEFATKSTAKTALVVLKRK